MTDQMTKGQGFQDLHKDGCFIIPNPWNVGSAKMMAGLGFKALASTSSGYARSTGVNETAGNPEFQPPYCRKEDF